MKAAVLKSWENMQMEEIEKPELKHGEALIKVKYAGVCGSDITVYSGKHPTATVPVVVGHEILGTIEAINASDNCKFKVGDRVTAEPLISCGVCEACKNGHLHVCKNLKLLGIHENGGYAEYTKVSVAKLVKVSDKVSDKVAALSEPFAVGQHVVSRSRLRIGDTAFIIGAGTIGMIIALSARRAGASRVVISEVNEKRLSLAKKLGFDIIDAGKTDVLAEVDRMTDGNGFDVVFEVSGSKVGALTATKVCKIRGTIVPMSLSGVPCEFELGKVSFKEISVTGSRVYTFDDFMRGVHLLENLSESYPLEELVSDVMPLSEAQTAIDTMRSGKNIGKILIECN